MPANKNKRMNGFTLMELIIVIILLGVMAVGIAGFITLTTQTYLNVSERDELVSSARFVVERLNREIRNAVPNSIRATPANALGQCIEFVPIETSAVYTDIPVSPEGARNTMEVIPFDLQGNLITVYPLVPDDIYDDHTDDVGKVFEIAGYTPPIGAETVAVLTLDSVDGVFFAQDSPTRRAFLFSSPVAYCVRSEGGIFNIYRYTGHSFTLAQGLPPFVGGTANLMAENILFDQANLPFTVNNATLQRNALVEVKLTFTRLDGTEQITFENAVHVSNIP